MSDERGPYRIAQEGGRFWHIMGPGKVGQGIEYHDGADADLDADRLNAAYRAGAEDMRQRAARVYSGIKHGCKHGTTVRSGHCGLCHSEKILALPLVQP